MDTPAHARTADRNATRPTSLLAALLALLVLVVATTLLVPAPAEGDESGGLLPDLETVVPRHLQLVNKQQAEVLRFSNGIANTGAGNLQLRPAFPLDPSSGTQDAYQEILDVSGAIVDSRLVSQFDYHEEHNHWHIEDVALFEVRRGAPDGPVVGANSRKTTFCLIDWYTLEGPAKTPDRNYWDCGASSEVQGITTGWVDQYNQAVPDQDLDITGAPTDELLYLVSTANPDGAFLEESLGNNTAWVSFRIVRESRGNPKLELVGRSACAGALCGDKAPNR